MSIFSNTQSLAPKRNKFDLSHDRKFTGNMGVMYPFFLQEIIPGDSFRVRSTVFVRFLALIAPIMHKVDVYCHFFFVPNRLLWANWQQFITGGEDGLAAPAFPTFNLGQAYASSPTYLRDGSLLDHLGFPTLGNAGVLNAGYNGGNYSVLPLKAYHLIYDQYYRNQNIEASQLPADFLADGAMAAGSYPFIMPLRLAMWEKDYFTSALPNTQRGTEVTIPISITSQRPGVGGATQPVMRKSADGSTLIPAANSAIDNENTQGKVIASGAAGYVDAYYDPNGTLSSSSLTINALRASVRLQEFLEKNMQGGGRYIEVIKMHFGVLSSDARLQRCEYLGGAKQPVTVSEVLTTAPPAAGPTYPPGTMAGHGIALGEVGFMKHVFEEHGFVMGIMKILPRTAYQQMVDPQFWRQVKTDFFWPEFAHLGEQTIRQQNVYLRLDDAAGVGHGLDIFGYQSRYSEYKFKNSSVHGQFKSTLQFWHLGRIFNAGPALNINFINASVRTDIFAVASDIDHVIIQVFHQVDAVRPMPYFGTPQL